jgi:hypothetical protein
MSDGRSHIDSKLGKLTGAALRGLLAFAFGLAAAFFGAASFFGFAAAFLGAAFFAPAAFLGAAFYRRGYQH